MNKNIYHLFYKNHIYITQHYYPRQFCNQFQYFKRFIHSTLNIIL